MSDPETLLLFGAFAPEVNLLRENLDAELLKVPVLSPGSPVANTVADTALRRVEIFEGGVGNLNCALNLQERILDRQAPPVAEAIFIGSAGVYLRSHDSQGPHPGPDFPGFSRTFYNREAAVLEGRARLPEPLTKTSMSTPGPIGETLAKNLDALEGATNSPDSLTLFAPVESEHFPGDINYENMETFGAAMAFLKYSIPFCAFFALTNYVGPEGSKEWSRVYKEYSTKLQARILDILTPMLGE